MLVSNNKLSDRCYICNVPLGESSNKLFVDGQWVHYTCAFLTAVDKVSRKKGNDNAQV